MNGVNRFGRGGASPPRNRRPLQQRRPNTVHTNRRPPTVTVVRHTPRRMIPSRGCLSAVDAATQRGNIQVVVRVRPTNISEAVPAHRTVVQVIDERLVVFDPKETVNDFYYHGKKQNSNGFLKRNKDVKFVFDRVYSASATNSEIFEGTIKKSLDTLLEGFNCSVFAYGATGSGKTFTMLGSGDENPGLTFLTMVDLYKRLENIDSEYESSVGVSYLEVYNETVRDLLNPGGKAALNILEDENGISVPHLTTVNPTDQSALFRLLSDGNSRRSQHPTDHNAESSRSHAVFQVHLTLRARFRDLQKSIRSAKLVMVDLAGSERGSATGCSGERFREGASINKSLLALGNCINSLADGKKHVPYRDSKLTRLLKDSLGGNCKTIVIANVSPSSLSYDDTHNTLKYANRAKNIVFNAKKNEVMVSARMAEYAKVVQEMQDRINFLSAENEIYKTSCRCLSNKTSDENSDEENSDNDDEEQGPIVRIDGFKNLKRRYSETLESVRMTETKIDIKKQRLNEIESSKDSGAVKTKAVDRLKRQVYQMEEKRDQLMGRCEVEKREVNAVLAAAKEEETTVPISQLLYYKGLEVELNIVKTRSGRQKDLFLEENQRTENLLGRCMSFLQTIYQVSRFHKNTTKQEETQYEALYSEYSGLKKLRWANEEEIKMGGVGDMETTYLAPRSGLNATYCTAVPGQSNVDIDTTDSCSALNSTYSTSSLNATYTATTLNSTFTRKF